MTISEAVKEYQYTLGYMTIGQCIQIAAKLNLTVGEVIISEACEFQSKSRKDVVQEMSKAFAHNIKATTIGLNSGRSGLLGTIGQDLNKSPNNVKIIDDEFVNRIVTCTLAAQVGNHSIGLCPCAGTGDACPYTGFVMAVR